MAATLRMLLVAMVIGGLVSFSLAFLAAAFGAADALNPAILSGTGITVLAFLVQYGLAANVKVKRLSAAEQSALLSSAPPPGQGALVVIRRGFVGKAVGMDVLVDGARMAQLKSPACVRLLAPAGPRQLTIAMPRAKAVPAALAVNIPSGGTAFFEAGLKSGLKSTLTLTPAADSAAALLLAQRTPMVAALA